jgi:predicted lipid-binding transport protein (Tim44 family)
MDITTLVFLGLTVFVIWKLRSVLGQKTGEERPPSQWVNRRDNKRPDGKPISEGARDNVVPLPGIAVEAPSTEERWKGIAESGSPNALALDEIAGSEPDFDAAGFLEGAKAAYEMIVLAFAQGDRNTLKGLLSREVYEGFERAISEREKRGEKTDTTFVSLDKAHLLHAEVKNRNAHITLRYRSKLITATRDAQGQIIDGSAEAVIDVTDIWTFARTLGSKDPNWNLIATEAEQ